MDVQGRSGAGGNVTDGNVADGNVADGNVAGGAGGVGGVADGAGGDGDGGIGAGVVGADGVDVLPGVLDGAVMDRALAHLRSVDPADRSDPGTIEALVRQRSEFDALLAESVAAFEAGVAETVSA